MADLDPTIHPSATQPRRQRGTGRIFSREDSRNLSCAYYLRGKEYRESTGTADPKQAEKFLKRRLKEVGADQIGARSFVAPKQERIVVSELLDALEKDYELRGKRNPQFDSHLARIRDYFGAARAVDVTAEIVDGFIEARRSADARPASINRGTQLLGQAFKLAIARRHLSSAPAIRRLPEKDNVRQGFFSHAEIRAVVSHLPEHLADVTLFAYLSGWRRGEIVSLEWSDVDTETIRLRPEHSKTGEGRTLVVDGELAELVERRRQRQRVETPHGPVLAALVFHDDGERIVDFRKSWRTACRMAGVPGKLFHDLRRSAVRDMIRSGVPERVAMSVSGHKTQSMLYRYCIVNEADQREALRRTEQYRAAEQQRVVGPPSRVQ